MVKTRVEAVACMIEQLRQDKPCSSESFDVLDEMDLGCDYNISPYRKIEIIGPEWVKGGLL